MIARIKNPFVTSGYIAPEYFCDREAERDELVRAFFNERNMVLVSPHRMGKTGLIEHCFHDQRVDDEFYTFFVDIYATGSLKELVFSLGKHIFDKLKPRGKKFVEQFFTIITSLRPAFKLDSVSGQPVFDIGIGDIKQPVLSLEEIFTYLENADRRCIVAIVEFQQIAKYPEMNVEALLRTYIQKCKNTNFVFSGSQRSMMQNIFFSASRPFYQSASLLSLEPIAMEVYREFVCGHFIRARKGITEECITRVYELFEGHTWYMQMMFNRLYVQTDVGEEMSVMVADKVLHATVESNRTVYQGMVSLLSERQKEVLFAIAKAGKAFEITSTKFIKEHTLFSSSSVQSAVRQLVEKELITKEESVYSVCDRFFGLWLAESYGRGYRL